MKSECAVCPNKLKEGKSLKYHMKGNYKRMVSAVKVDRKDEDEIKSKCAVSQYKLKEENMKGNMKWIHKSVESAVKVDRRDEDDMKSECAVCQYKLKEEKSLKSHMK